MAYTAPTARRRESFNKFFDRRQFVTYIQEDHPGRTRLASTDYPATGNLPNCRPRLESAPPASRSVPSAVLNDFNDGTVRFRVPSPPSLLTWNEHMHLGFNLKPLFFRALLTVVVALATTQPVAAQSNSTEFSHTASSHAVISSLLTEGQSLEADGRWGDAIAHYQDAIREHPGDNVLEQRFDFVKLNYSLERRLNDRSFRQSAATLSPQQTLDQYSELLTKINTHYFTTPPWNDLVGRGSRAVTLALSDPNFRKQHRIQPTAQQLARLRQEVNATLAGRQIRTRAAAATAASEVARLVRYRTGLRQSATLLEFTAAAANGLDTYSSFLTADQLRDVYSQIEGNFVGLGVELKADDGALLIVHVIPGSPAERAGILDGDRIVAVDGKRTDQYSTDEAASMLTGEEGSQVKVTIERAAHKTASVTVRREHVNVPSLEDVEIIDREQGVAYLKIPAFQKSTATDLEKALWDLHGKGMRSLIIDLRGNPGGLLTSSVEIADKFVASGRIVSTRGRSQAETFDYRAHRAGTWRVPLVVLIDGDSASASEIFAAAIKDAGRGKIVGSRSYGKGSVQGIFPLGTSGAGIRLTTAKFFSPDDHPISKVGVSPDVDTVQTTTVHATESAHLVGFRGTDANADDTLARAVEIASNEPAPVL